MNLSRCENGHFFDKEKFATCPHCAQGAKKDDSLTTIFENEGINNEVEVTEAVDSMENNLAESIEEAKKRSDVFSEETETIEGQNIPTGIPTNENRIYSVNAQNNVHSNDPDDDQTIGIYDFEYDDLFKNTATAQTINQSSSVSNNSSHVNRVPVAPCTGWVIALNGNHLGQDFRLKVGKNFVGRDASMDVALTGDKSVSRNRHTILVYEPKQHLYLVQPGESSELVYLNDEVVLSPMKLQAYDIITIGEVNLLFIPLCGAKFNWADILRKKN